MTPTRRPPANRFHRTHRASQPHRLTAAGLMAGAATMLAACSEPEFDWHTEATQLLPEQAQVVYRNESGCAATTSDQCQGGGGQFMAWIPEAVSQDERVRSLRDRAVEHGWAMRRTLEHGGGELRLELGRDGHELTLTVTPDDAVDRCPLVAYSGEEARWCDSLHVE